MDERALPEGIVPLVDALLERAVGEKATDIHFVPAADGGIVRIRVDGLLRDLHPLTRDAYPKVVGRIKVQAEIDIAERRRPQEGRFSLEVGGRRVDFRLSDVPTLHGESIVLRILDRQAGLLTLGGLGLSAKEIQVFRSVLTNPSGIVIVTGPTGAGKTTTLYAGLLELAVPERNVISIEDPIEYEIPRVLQTHVQPRLDVTFASLLRSLLRHDPDVILVGEVRDPETAEVAVRAALTGHLVLTSLHAHRTADAIATMRNLGVRPYALAPALRGVVAQQLVRRICPACRTRFEYGETLLDDPDFAGLLKEGERPSFSIGMGCDACFRSGYRGRQGIFEILPVDEEIRGMILDSAGTAEIEAAAVRSGMLTLRRRGFLAVLEGLTTVEEVIRVVQVE